MLLACLHLDSGLFLRACIWQALPVVYCVSLRLLLEVFHTLSTSCFCPRSSHLEIWANFHVPFVGCILFGQCLAGQWIPVHAHLSGVSGRIFGIFSVKESSNPAVDSRPALLGIFASCSMEECAQSMLRSLELPALVALGIWTLCSRAPCI